jgi:hypothetical protein
MTMRFTRGRVIDRFAGSASPPCRDPGRRPTSGGRFAKPPLPEEFEAVARNGGSAGSRGQAGGRFT